MVTVEDKKKWICLYPAYINSKRTLAEGRRIKKEKVKINITILKRRSSTKYFCVFQGIENPTASEINDVLKSAGLNTEIEEVKI